MNNNNSKASTNPQIQNFLESLKSRASMPRPDMPGFGMERFQESKRLEEQRKAEFFRSRTREFNQVYSHQKQEESAKIEQIKEKLQSLAKSVKKLDQEVHNATIQNLPQQTQGVYYESFLEHLAQMIDLLKRQVESSNTWLHVFNQKGGKKSYYWGMVAKQGTSFMLNNERQVATSVG